MNSHAPLGYMSGAKKGNICTHKSRVDTYVEEKAVTHVPTGSAWIHEWSEKERHMYPK